MSAAIIEQEHLLKKLTKPFAQSAFSKSSCFNAHVDADGNWRWHVVWELFDRHETVIAVWPDASNPNLYDLMLIKGALPNSKDELALLKITAIACKNYDEATGLSIMYQARGDQSRRSAV